MFDLAYVDTEVVDVDGEPTLPIARSRVPTKDLTVHVHLDDGFWHRLDPSGLETACGLRVNLRLRQAVRNERELEHPLSQSCDCFTRKERERADAAWRQKFGTEPP